MLATLMSMYGGSSIFIQFVHDLLYLTKLSFGSNGFFANPLLAALPSFIVAYGPPGAWNILGRQHTDL